MYLNVYLCPVEDTRKLFMQIKLRLVRFISFSKKVSFPFPFEGVITWIPSTYNITNTVYSKFSSFSSKQQCLHIFIWFSPPEITYNHQSVSPSFFAAEKLEVQSIYAALMLTTTMFTHAISLRSRRLIFRVGLRSFLSYGYVQNPLLYNDK